MDQKEKKFVSILESHKGILYKVTNMYCLDKSDQDDLIQEIALQIWLSFDKFNDQYKWSTWIYRIALNTSISYYRKDQLKKKKIERLDSIIEWPSDFDEPIEDENYILLRRFIRELKEIDRALILMYLEGLSSQEIADIMATTQTNVTTKISRIKNILKTKFKNHKN